MSQTRPTTPVIRDVVDEQDRVIGQATKEEIESSGLICRVSFTLIENSRGELVLQQRKATKRAYPLFWSGAAAGHLVSGETYEEGARRELCEELGIATELRCLGKYYSRADREMVAIFLGVHDGPYRFEEAEIEQIALMTPARLIENRDNMQLTSFLEAAIPMLTESSA